MDSYILPLARPLRIRPFIVVYVLLKIIVNNGTNFEIYCIVSPYFVNMKGLLSLMTIQLCTVTPGHADTGASLRARQAHTFAEGRVAFGMQRACVYPRPTTELHYRTLILRSSLIHR